MKKMQQVKLPKTRLSAEQFKESLARYNLTIEEVANATNRSEKAIKRYCYAGEGYEDGVPISFDTEYRLVLPVLIKQKFESKKITQESSPQQYAIHDLQKLMDCFHLTDDIVLDVTGISPKCFKRYKSGYKEGLPLKFARLLIDHIRVNLT